ncbi:uncharacterized protein C2845_PM07G21860 [Panicum miliaceum]|uniref:Uncharacterized protein n=1 Tax=Panicum miliaceum TaxID=4540 RepID=A0A3L6SMR8_PANMI|nr:uncharacterized protein C2845_PM07G21860 [Panicum miliaceum]
MAKELNVELGYELLDTCQLDDLAKLMLQLAPGDLGTACQNVLEHVFFWEKLERKKFFVYRIPLALQDKDFRTKVEKCKDLCHFPWRGSGDFAGIIQKMDQHRKANNKAPYDKYSNLGFVECTSGLYSHESVLKEKVDDIVQKFHPRLCSKLFSMLPRPTSDKRWL